jgi:frataxin-like iron-binding protein CyaY
MLYESDQLLSCGDLTFKEAAYIVKPKEQSANGLVLASGQNGIVYYSPSGLSGWFSKGDNPHLIDKFEAAWQCARVSSWTPP